MKLTKPIGVFDSGLGGLSVLRHLQKSLPHENLLYFADQAHVPYGSRSREDIVKFSEEITRFLLSHQSKIIVVACNTATAAALHLLRQNFSEVPFVGMEPAVKPAALNTQTGKVGVLATQTTFASPRYEQLMARFAGNVQVYENPCLGLVPLIEAGKLEERETEKLLAGVLDPMIDQGIDTLVLGCTHYPFVQPLIEKLIADRRGVPAIKIIDPAPAVARQTKKVLENRYQLSSSETTGKVQLYTSDDPQKLSNLSFQLLGQQFEVKGVSWRNGKLGSA